MFNSCCFPSWVLQVPLPGTSIWECKSLRSFTRGSYCQSRLAGMVFPFSNRIRHFRWNETCFWSNSPFPGCMGNVSISNGLNSCYYSYQRFWHTNEANGSLPMVLTPQPRLYAAANRSIVCGLYCNNTAIQTYICMAKTQCWNLSRSLLLQYLILLAKMSGHSMFLFFTKALIFLERWQF